MVSSLNAKLVDQNFVIFLLRNTEVGKLENPV